MAVNLGAVFYTLGANTAGLVNAVTGVRVFGAAVASQQAKADGFVNALRNLESASVLAVGPLSGVGARIRSLGMLMNSTSVATAGFVAGFVGAGFALFKLGQAAIQSNLRLLAMNQRLVLLTGSIGGAGVEFRRLIELANRSGVELGQVATSYSKLSAATKGTFLEGDRTTQMFDKMTMLGGNLVLTNEQMELSFLALEQMISKGVISMEELRRQLGDQIPGAFQSFARSMKVSTAELTKLIKAGKVGIDTLEPFIDELLRTFGIDPTKQVDSLRASMGRLNTEWLLFSNTIDRTFGVSAAWKATLEGLTSALSGIGKNITNIIPYLGAAAAGLTIMFGPMILQGVLTLTGLILKLTLAVIGLNAATAASPLALLARLALMAAAAAGAKVAFDNLTQSINGLSFDNIKKEADSYVASNAKFNKAQISMTRDLITQVETRIETYKAELEAYKTHLEGMSTSASDFQNEQAQKFPKLTTAIRTSIIGYLFGWDSEAEAGKDKANINAIDNALQGLEGTLRNLRGVLAGQEGLPGIPGMGDDADAQTKAQINKLERINFTLEQTRMRIQALKEGPSAVAFTDKFMQAEASVESFRQTLEDAGISQAELSAKVGEFRKLLFEEIELTPMAEGLKQLQDVFVDVFKTISDTIAHAMVEGKFAIQDFVDVGKKFLEQLISKLIELAIFNPLLNALMGTQQPVLGGALASIFAPHAKGTVLTSPTILGKTGKKFDLGGERGPEGVLPLARTSSGDLGVKAMGMGGGGGSYVEVNIINNAGVDIKQEETTGDNGQARLDIVLDRMVADSVRTPGSRSNSALRRNFGLQNTLTRR
jgi:tape measure domain-containing protein